MCPYRYLYYRDACSLAHMNLFYQGPARDIDTLVCHLNGTLVCHLSSTCHRFNNSRGGSYSVSISIPFTVTFHSTVTITQERAHNLFHQSRSYTTLYVSRNIHTRGGALDGRGIQGIRHLINKNPLVNMIILYLTDRRTDSLPLLLCPPFLLVGSRGFAPAPFPLLTPLLLPCFQMGFLP